MCSPAHKHGATFDQNSTHLPSIGKRLVTCHCRRPCVGLIRTIYGAHTVFFGREITKYTAKYGVYIRFWPTLTMCSPMNKHGATFDQNRTHLPCIAIDDTHHNSRAMLSKHKSSLTMLSKHKNSRAMLSKHNIKHDVNT